MSVSSSELEGVLAVEARYYRERAGEYDDWWFRRGRYDHSPKEIQALEDRLEALGWRAHVEQTPEFFLYGSASLRGG